MIRQWEIDGFDVMDPLYLLSVDQNNQVVSTKAAADDRLHDDQRRV